MRHEGITIIIGASAALELALDALEDLDLPVRSAPTVAAAETVLRDTPHRWIRAVLVDLTTDPERGLALIRHFRSRGRQVPVAVWAGSATPQLLASAYAAGANSAVSLDGSGADASRLAALIHYWCVDNQPPRMEPVA
jgi:DNA-binding NtrC family response regulator